MMQSVRATNVPWTAAKWGSDSPVLLACHTAQGTSQRMEQVHCHLPKALGAEDVSFSQDSGCTQLQPRDLSRPLLYLTSVAYGCVVRSHVRHRSLYAEMLPPQGLVVVILGIVARGCLTCGRLFRSARHWHRACAIEHDMLHENSCGFVLCHSYA